MSRPQRTYKNPRIPNTVILNSIEQGLKRVAGAIPTARNSGVQLLKIHAAQAEEVVLRDDADLERFEDDDFDVDAFLDEEDGDEESEFDDIEIAISEFVTWLLDQKLIKPRSSNDVTFSQAFESIFGVGTEIADAARKFERLLESYFGFISEKRKRLASEELARITGLIEDYRGAVAK